MPPVRIAGITRARPETTAFSATVAMRCRACTWGVAMSMKLVGCRGCGNLVGAHERACPFCGVALASPRRGLAAGVVLAGLVLGGCASKGDTPLGEEGTTDAVDDTDSSTTLFSTTTGGVTSTSQGTVDPPNSEATYGVPGTDSDWYGTESDTETTGIVHDTEGSATDPDTDTDAPESESDTDTDTDGPASDTEAASSDAG